MKTLRKSVGEEDVHLFVGARRAWEREASVQRLSELGFIGDTDRPPRNVFLVATSAAEVGVDLDADHMVCDLVPWERLVQRLGRVNRRGRGSARVLVVDQGHEAYVKMRHGDSDAAGQYQAIHDLLQALATETGFDASPGALRALQQEADVDAGVKSTVDLASTKEPYYPELEDPIVEAWAMTSFPENPGRPAIEPWLRGWVDDEPQTTIIWRRWPFEVPRCQETSEIEPFFESTPPRLIEKLETESGRVAKWLYDRARKLGKDGPGDAPVGYLLTRANEVAECVELNDILTLEREWLVRRLSGKTLVVDRRFGGLRDGLLDATSAQFPSTVDGDDDASLGSAATVAIGFRVRKVTNLEDTMEERNWQERFRMPFSVDSEGAAEQWLSVDKWRGDAANEDDRGASPRPQTLAEHAAWTADQAIGIASRLGLAKRYCRVLQTAARLHDEGKRGRWQRAFNAPADGEVYAKTRGPINQSVLGGYRHEFGSIPHAERDAEFRDLTVEEQDLVLHLIASHHGHARPTISTAGCEDAPPSILQKRAREVALRFLRLQKRWGPWGLAWWEALLRAADQRASRQNDLLEERSR